MSTLQASRPNHSAYINSATHPELCHTTLQASRPNHSAYISESMHSARLNEGSGLHMKYSTFTLTHTARLLAWSKHMCVTSSV
jgi:hypothetical protein